jgi:hypothetical protein
MAVLGYTCEYRIQCCLHQIILMTAHGYQHMLMHLELTVPMSYAFCNHAKTITRLSQPYRISKATNGHIRIIVLINTIVQL